MELFAERGSSQSPPNVADTAALDVSSGSERCGAELPAVGQSQPMSSPLTAPSPAGAEESLQKVYTFLASQKKDVLRKVGRVWGLRSSGNKQDLIYRAFWFLKDCQSRNLNIFGKLAANIHCPSFDNFEKENSRSGMDWKEPPGDDVIREALKKAGDKLESRDAIKQRVEREEGCNEVADVPSTPNFTLSEFARLLVLMKEDEKVRESMYRLGQELRRAELDTGTSRDSFWGIIEARFNDVSLLVKFSFEGYLSDADPSAPPLCNRSGEVLKGHFRDAKSVFTKALDRWNRSGQNDPDKFVDFLSCNGQSLYASSKRALAMFVVSKLGTPYQDSFFVELSCKTIWEGGYEAGMKGMDRVRTSDERENQTAMEAGKKKRRTSNNLVEVVEKHLDKVGQISSFSGGGGGNGQ